MGETVRDSQSAMAAGLEGNSDQRASERVYFSPRDPVQKGTMAMAVHLVAHGLQLVNYDVKSVLAPLSLHEGLERLQFLDVDVLMKL